MGALREPQPVAIIASSKPIRRVNSRLIIGMIVTGFDYAARAERHKMVVPTK